MLQDIIRTKYLRGKDVAAGKLVAESPSWKDILNARDIYFAGRKVNLVSGNICIFWHYPIDNVLLCVICFLWCSIFFKSKSVLPNLLLKEIETCLSEEISLVMFHNNAIQCYFKYCKEYLSLSNQSNRSTWTFNGKLSTKLMYQILGEYFGRCKL
jgi:hypothetical protein